MSKRWRRGIAAFPLAFMATTLAAGDGRFGWALLVGVVTFVLAYVAVALIPEDPDAEAKAEARQQARVDKILDKYERERGRR